MYAAYSAMNGGLIMDLRRRLTLACFALSLLLVGCHERAASPAAPAATETKDAALEPQVCAGEAHTCVRTSAGKVLCTGRNLDGELGDGTAMDRLGFVPVVGLADAT